MKISLKTLVSGIASACAVAAMMSIPTMAAADGVSPNSLSSCPSGYLCL